MKAFRVVAKCGGKARAKTRTEKEIPAKGDYYYLSPEVGEVLVTDTSPGEEMPVVMVTVTATAFKHLTLVEGWSAVE